MLVFLALVLVVQASTNGAINGDFETNNISPWIRTAFNGGAISPGPNSPLQVKTFQTVAGTPSLSGSIRTGRTLSGGTVGGSNIVQGNVLICPGNTFVADIATSSEIQIASTYFAFVHGTSSVDAGLSQGTVYDIKDTPPLSGFTARRQISDTIPAGWTTQQGWIGLRVGRTIVALLQQVTAHVDNFVFTDPIAPTITCPANIVANADATACSTTVTFAASASDNCAGEFGPTISYSQNSGTTFPVGETTVTATATDAYGNVASCSFTVTVNDVTAPTCSVAPSVSLGAEACAGNNLASNPFTYYDNCGVVGQKYSYHPQGTSDNSEALFLAEIFPLGLSAVQADFTDAAGNSNSCNTVIGVNLCCPAVPHVVVVPEKK